MEPFETIDRIRNHDSYSARDVEDLTLLTRVYPDEPELWDVLGDVMQACNQDRPIEDSMKCYIKALECDESYAPAYESIGWALDTYFDDFDGAEKNFLLALKHGAGDTARIGLSRVLGQTGRDIAATNYLNDCHDQTRSDLIEMRREIAEGIWFSDSSKTA